MLQGSVPIGRKKGGVSIPLSDNNLLFLKCVDKLTDLLCFKEWKKQSLNISAELLYNNIIARADFKDKMNERDNR